MRIWAFLVTLVLMFQGGTALGEPVSKISILGVSLGMPLNKGVLTIEHNLSLRNVATRLSGEDVAPAVTDWYGANLKSVVTIEDSSKPASIQLFTNSCKSIEMIDAYHSNGIWIEVDGLKLLLTDTGFEETKDKLTAILANSDDDNKLVVKGVSGQTLELEYIGGRFRSARLYRLNS